MDLKDFEKLANKEHGLVPMRVTEGFAPYAENAIAGFFPGDALQHFTGGHAVPVDANGKDLVVTKANPTPPATPGAKTPGSVVPIPEGWEKEHHLKRVKLAKEISGNDSISKADEADPIIAAEVERRAADARAAADIKVAG